MMAFRRGKTESSWGKLFDKYDIVEHVKRDGVFRITAEQIKEFREPRLMAKFDHKKNLPSAFCEHGFGILPVSRGDYIIGPFKLFASHPIPDEVNLVSRASLPGTVESVSPDSISSESVALNCAWDSNMLHGFLGEETLYPTLSGRMGSHPFAFRIHDELGVRNSEISVDGAQIEIDAAYEGACSIVVIEAKMNLAEDFIVRQLYYPFRHFSTLAIKKRVRMVYLTYTGGVFHLDEYSFKDPLDYNSIFLVKSGRYVLGASSVSCEDLWKILESTIAEPEPDGIPFPQADTFARVVNLCERLAVKSMTKEDIEECYGFDPRQADYYYNAAAYLGLAKKVGGRGSCVVLTPDGRDWATSSVAKRNSGLIRRILCHEPFRRVLRMALLRGSVPEAGEIRNVLLATNPRLGDASKATYGRRASTVRHWIQWMLNLVGQ